MPRELFLLKATAVFPQREVGGGEAASGGVYDLGTQEEDGPGTWEAHVLLGKERQHGEPDKNLRRATCLRTHELPARKAKNKRPRRGRRAARGDRSYVAEGNEESEGRVGAWTSGAGLHPDPAEQRRPVSMVNFRREP